MYPNVPHVPPRAEADQRGRGSRPINQVMADDHHAAGRGEPRWNWSSLQQRQTTARRRLIARKPRPPVRWIATRHFFRLRTAAPLQRLRYPSVAPCAPQPTANRSGSANSVHRTARKRPSATCAFRKGGKWRAAVTTFLNGGNWKLVGAGVEIENKLPEQSATIFFYPAIQGEVREIAGWAFLGGAEM